MRTLPVAGLAVLAVLLAGCLQQQPTVDPVPQPTPTLVFASEEEALAAAEEAYAAYLAMSDLIASEGGANPERIAPFVTESHLESAIGDIAFLSDRGLHAVGATTFDRVELQSYFEDVSGLVVVVYLCLDVSKVRILDGDLDSTPLSRPDRVPLEVRLVDSPLKVDASEVWDSGRCS